MDDITKLATLAEKRLGILPLEQQWEKTYRVQPVVQGIECDRERRRKREVQYGGGVAFLLFSFLCFTLFRAIASLSDPPPLLALSIVVALILTGGMALVGIWYFVSGFFRRWEGFAMAERYAKALFNFVKWSGITLEELSKCNEFGMNSLKSEAIKILVEYARSTLLFEERNKNDAHNPEHAREHAERLEGMKERADTLVLLGLIPEGSYDPYFRRARKEIATKRKNAPAKTVGSEA